MRIGALGFVFAGIALATNCRRALVNLEQLQEPLDFSRTMAREWLQEVVWAWMASPMESSRCSLLIAI